ncbi:MAG TPA: ATP-dependent sacrificial sulfur transferase LarE [Polyangiales bacterium]|nr:ATP-dependent sacrificial sulfur transferase LarE [Polyangiales bacterium]
MQPKLERLRDTMREMRSIVVAFSGGLDSAFVLAIAHDTLGANAIGVTAWSPSVPMRERSDAARIATELGARHRVIESRELHDPRYAANPDNRCFYCKSELYRRTEEVRRELGFEHVANGTNLDDLGDYRPGLEAAKQASVRSPLVDAALSKSEIRTLAHELGLNFWDKPAAACLSSRIPYGTAVTPERLSQIEQLEDALHALGLRQVRVRYHDSLARIEVAKDELDAAFGARDAIVQAGKRAGFTYVSLDLAGYRTGSLNELLRVVR